MTPSKFVFALVSLLTVLPVGQVHGVYDAGTGRWLTRDPWGYRDGGNRYQYVRGNPVRSSDSSGLVTAIRCGTPKNQLPPGGWPPAGGYPIPELAPAQPGSLTDQHCCLRDFPQRGPDDPIQGPLPLDGQSPGLVTCCEGRLVVCVNDEMIGHELGRWPKVAAAARDCVMKCEPLHCPNFGCDAGRNGIPGLNGQMSFECSEYAVTKCGCECMLAACGGNQGNCSLCDGDLACRGAASRYISKFCDARDHWGPLCAAQSPSTQPSTHPSTQPSSQPMSCLPSSGVGMRNVIMSN